MCSTIHYLITVNESLKDIFDKIKRVGCGEGCMNIQNVGKWKTEY